MTRLALLIAGLTLLLSVPASATHVPVPSVDRAVIKSTYKPIGFYKPGDAIPSPLDLPKADADGLFNPSGNWNALDNNVYETLNFPTRQANDQSNADPLGSGDPRHGFCPPSATEPQFNPYGKCANHQLEFLDYYERTMKAVLKDFGVTVRRQDFVNGDPEDPARPICCGLSTAGGTAHNMYAIVPGADHPEQYVLVGAHFDTTDTGPATTWDSSEGHAQTIRMAAIMAEYWKATGSRPSATMVFVPWDQEEAGSVGSETWLATHTLDGKAPETVRAYFNTDPCTAGFPAYYRGNPAEQRISEVLQLADPADDENPDATKAFNDQSTRVIDEFWADIDDTIETVAGPMPVYTDADRQEIVVALGGLLAFGSDYSNFDELNVPVFNMFADNLGPHADGSQGDSAEGASYLHTPRDNLQTLNMLTGPDQSGTTFSDGWVKSQEFCAQIHSRGMLQPNMAGAQTVTNDPVAFFEAGPSVRAAKGKLVTMDASGTYQYAALGSRAYVDDSRLQYKWDFGDQSAPAFGKVVKHAYKSSAVFQATLTVTNRDTGQTDSVKRQIEVGDGDGNESDPAGQSQDAVSSGGPGRPGEVVACQSGAGFTSLSVRAAGKGIRVEGQVRQGQGFVAELFQAAKGRRALKAKRIDRFSVNGATTYTPKKRLAAGTYYLRVSTRGTGPRPEYRFFGFDRRGSRFKALPSFAAPDSCDTVSLFRLDAPAFDAKRSLGISVATTKAGRLELRIFRGKAKKPAKRFTKTVPAGSLQRFKLSGRKLKRGTYRVVVYVDGKASGTLQAKRL